MIQIQYKTTFNKKKLYFFIVIVYFRVFNFPGMTAYIFHFIKFKIEYMILISYYYI